MNSVDGRYTEGLDIFMFYLEKTHFIFGLKCFEYCV